MLSPAESDTRRSTRHTLAQAVMALLSPAEFAESDTHRSTRRKLAQAQALRLLELADHSTDEERPDFLAEAQVWATLAVSYK
jgi:hypothetical protein